MEENKQAGETVTKEQREQILKDMAKKNLPDDVYEKMMDAFKKIFENEGVEWNENNMKVARVSMQIVLGSYAMLQEDFNKQLLFYVRAGDDVKDTGIISPIQTV